MSYELSVMRERSQYAQQNISESRHHVPAARLYPGGQNRQYRLHRRTGERCPDGSVVGKGDPEAQARQIWHNLEAAVKSVGGTLNNIVKTTTYVTNLNYAAAIRKVREERLTNPPGTLLVVAGLASPDYMMEIEARAKTVDQQALQPPGLSLFLHTAPPVDTIYALQWHGGELFLQDERTQQYDKNWINSTQCDDDGCLTAFDS